jgi:hypothetical protein
MVTPPPPVRMCVCATAPADTDCDLCDALAMCGTDVPEGAVDGSADGSGAPAGGADYPDAYAGEHPFGAGTEHSAQAPHGEPGPVHV